MSGLPSGAVTFLFSDIEGSTRLVKALRERYRQVLAEHRRLVRAAIAGQGGHEVDTQGDAFFVAFAGAKQAVLCALEIQRSLAAQEWPAGAAVRVRIGVHTGGAVPAEGGYTGLAVHRAARICATARGGQVLVSQATQTIIEDEEEDPGFTLIDLGERTLKDLDRPARLFQLTAPGLEQAVLRHGVPLVDLDQAQHNLPARLTSFVGREDELAQLGKLLGQARLVTLTGPGGAGKTRLAVEVAAGVMDRFGDGAWLADLAGIGDPGLIGAQVMEALGVRQADGVPVLETLRDRLRSAELLLVLDNCEHLLDACAELTLDLLAGAPGLRVLATSREPLGVPGEAAFPVPPLAIPAADTGPAVLAAAPAVRLFADRASSARPDAVLVEAQVPVIGRICRQLDGLPLAIELAAARASLLSVEEIESHLADKFRFLTYRRPAAGGPRHQALKAAIDWSYKLLPAAEQQALAQLSVFAGGFALAQAAQVCCGGDRGAALDVVDRLASKSLVAADTTGPQTRYRMLETIRQYAAGCLDDAGETPQAQQRHAGAFLDLAELEQDLNVLSREQDNFRAALEWALSQGSDTGPRLARALGGFWLARGLLLEGQAWLERALGTGPEDPWLRTELLRLLGTVLYSSDIVRAESLLSEGSRVAEEAGLPAIQARIRVHLGDMREMLGRPGVNALEECQEAAAVLESEGDLAGLAEAWIRIGTIRGNVHGDVLAAVEAYDRAAAYARASGNHYAEQDARAWQGGAYQVGPIPLDTAISRAEQFLDQASGDPWAEASVLQSLSALYAQAGRFDDARAAVSRAQSAHTRSGAKIYSAVTTAIAGEIELIAGAPAAAEQPLKQACQTLRAVGERGNLASTLPTLAEAVHAQGRLDEAYRLTEDAEKFALPDDLDTQARWRATRAKILARRGQYAIARQLIDEAETLATPTSWTALQAHVLEAKAEVARLAGATAEAETCLRAALDLHQQRRAAALVDRTRAALARLSIPPASH